MRISLNVIENPNGVILYKGPSLLNGKPIVVIATGLRAKSKNDKTGEFIQVYILSDEEETPLEALNSGKDESVCGDCIHRKQGGWGTCYVNVGQAPVQIYRAYKRGSYVEFNLSMLDDYFSGRKIRLGSYGDPAAVPVRIWRLICGVSEGWTGYTHQWRVCDPELRFYCMASVDTVYQQKIARKRGWKTFRVRNDDEPLQPHEFVCPAGEEAGHRLQCEDCMACHGGIWNGRQFTPVIRVHGTSYKPRRFRKMQRLMRQKKRYRYLHSSVGFGTRSRKVKAEISS